MKKVFVFMILVLSLVPRVQAEYVLPYPSYMPGNKLYRVSRMIDTLKAYWYWGNIASFRYHLGLSDKYLVEAKTLFEYKQYLLANDALKRSTDQFQSIPIYVKGAQRQKKDITVMKKTVQEAVEVHRGVLESISWKAPETFLWQPEKSNTTELPLGRNIREAIQMRETVLTIVDAL